jgi:hypothetical protein
MIDIATYKQMHPPDPKKAPPVMNQDEYVSQEFPRCFPFVLEVEGAFLKAFTLPFDEAILLILRQSWSRNHLSRKSTFYRRLSIMSSKDYTWVQHEQKGME